MKKTLIAMAVAGVVAAPIASADVAVSGKVEQNFTWTDSSTSASDEMVGGSDVLLVFKASEDLGNGLSAFADIRTDYDGANGAQATMDTKVGLTGGFGTVVVGRMEDFSESKVLSMVDVFGGGTGVELGGDNATRQDNGFAYVSPSFSGLTIGVAGYALDDTANDIEDVDATDVALMYANGPVVVNLSQEEYKDDTGADNEEITSLGVSYAAGDLKVAVVYQDIDNAATIATDDHEDMMIAATYNMGGNNSIAVGWNENELTTGATENNTTAVEFRHNFSSRTRAYIGMTSDDFATTADETDEVYVGLEHSF